MVSSLSNVTFLPAQFSANAMCQVLSSSSFSSTGIREQTIVNLQKKNPDVFIWMSEEQSPLADRIAIQHGHWIHSQLPKDPLNGLDATFFLLLSSAQGRIPSLEALVLNALIQSSPAGSLEVFVRM